MSESKTAPYTVVRASNFFDNMYYMFYRLGIQSGILTSARYSSTNPNEKLTHASVVAALKQVVEAHSMLSAVAVQRPSVNKGNHRLHIAMLHKINVEECVEFLEGAEAGPEFFEKLHNQWDWLDDEPTKPWWKVYVLNGRDVVFLFHHLLCDGLSGMTFHRTFLRALNSLPSGISNPVSHDSIVSIDPSKTKLFPHATTLSRHKPNMLEAIYLFLFYFFLPLIFGKRVLFCDLPKGKPHPISISEVATPEQRTVTNVSTFRIPADKMASILEACRKRKTTFTPLLNVMLLVTFSTDIFPKAVVGLSSYAYSLAKYINMPQLEGVEKSDGVIANAANGAQHPHFLSKYRNVVVDMGLMGQKALDEAAAWELVQDYGQMMQSYMPNRGMRSWIATELVGRDLEDFIHRGFSGLGWLSMIFMNSNIGAFTVPEEQGDKTRSKWRVDDFQWSAPTTNGNKGPRGFTFSVAGLKGGDTVINLSYEEGVVSRKMAEDVLGLTMQKIEAMI